ncbi:MAG TPA: CoA-binding protein [Reyranella sp.]
MFSLSAFSPFFAPRSIVAVGAGERAISSGSAIMQPLRQAGYGGRVVPVNPKGGTIFGYESVPSIAAIDPPVDLAVIGALHGRRCARHCPARRSGSPPWSERAFRCSTMSRKWRKRPGCWHAIRRFAIPRAATLSVL